jgi:hypothetical protein
MWRAAGDGDAQSQFTSQTHGTSNLDIKVVGMVDKEPPSTKDRSHRAPIVTTSTMTPARSNCNSRECPPASPSRSPARGYCRQLNLYQGRHPSLLPLLCESQPEANPHAVRPASTFGAHLIRMNFRTRGSKNIGLEWHVSSILPSYGMRKLKDFGSKRV